MFLDIEVLSLVELFYLLLMLLNSKLKVDGKKNNFNYFLIIVFFCVGWIWVIGFKNFENEEKYLN